MLGTISQERLQEAAQDEAFLAHLDRVRRDLDDYLNRPGSWPRQKLDLGRWTAGDPDALVPSRAASVIATKK